MFTKISSTFESFMSAAASLRKRGLLFLAAAIAITSAQLNALAGLEIRMPSVRSHYKVECVREGKVIWTECFSNLVTTVGKNDILQEYFKSAATITNFALTSNVVTITAANNFTAGQWVLVQLVTNTTYNGIFQVASANSTTFTYNFTHANVSSGADTGNVSNAPSWFVGLVGSTHVYAAGDTMASHAGWTESTSYSNGTRPTLTLGSVSAGSVDNSASKAQFNINGTDTINGAFIATDSAKSGTTGVLYGEADFTGGSRSVQSGDTLNVTVTLTAS